MKQTWKLFFGVVCSVILALFVLPVEAAVTNVFVSISPQKYFVQKIGGDLVNVSVLVPAGASPHNFEPKPRQMAELSKSAVYFAVGIDFEKVWLKKIAAANPKMRIVHTDDGITKISMAGVHDEEKNGHDHSSGSPDPHIWLSPSLVKSQARHILDALVAIDPGNRSKYEFNSVSFMKEIDELDAELKAFFASRKGGQFMVFHPSWGYFAEAYGLVQVPVEIEGKDPKPAQLQKIIGHARERQIKVIFVQPQFSAKSAELLAREIGGQIVYTDPLTENWAGNLREVARKFGAAAR
jgi:zinc transport system substrate-binding protein